VTCVGCQREIEPNEVVWYEIIGWEKERRGGGTNAVFARTRTGTVMCDGCRLKIKFGGSTGQGDLFAQGT
jgi:hypothetical protein